MNKTALSVLCAATLLAAVPAAAQTPPTQPPAAPAAAQPPVTASAGLKRLYTTVRGFVTRAADAMPEEHYGFKPTPEVRSFGELLAHIANTQYTFCTPPRKVANPNKVDLEKTATTKAALAAALKDAFAFCDPAYDGGDAALNEMVKMGTREIAADYALTFNVAHIFEHYGNIVTYMRLKGLVPPSSEGAGR
jgi:uncharacterized damage-inducible protein DinB